MADWKNDQALEDDLQDYVRRNFQRLEILDFLKEKYPMYHWSLRTLGRRMSYFDVKYTNYDVDVARVEEAVKKEIDGPGKLLGYRAMHKKVREIHKLNVPRSLVYNVMTEVDPEGLKVRGDVGRPRRPRRDNTYTAEGSDFTMSLDGHDKLCGFQKSMFPLCIYGGQDTFSGRINFLRIWTTNNKPEVIGRFYFDYLFDSHNLPQRIRVDRGTETTVMTTMHCYLQKKLNNLDDATETILYGPSTQNKIERWWRELLERLETYFKAQLSELLESGDYDPSDDVDRSMLAYIYIPLLQKELNTFKDTVWNNHRGRKQKDKKLPDGIPEHIYKFPENYGGRNCGTHVSDEDLQEVAEVSSILDNANDYVEPRFCAQCEKIFPGSMKVLPKEAVLAFRFLKQNFTRTSVNTM